MARLTVRALDAAKPEAKDYKLTVERGLLLRVAVTGVKSWLVRYSVNGKQIQVRLPKPYGSGEGCMSLAEAIAENSRIQALARDNVDFQAQRAEADQAAAAEAARLAAQNAPFSAVFEQWLSDGVARSDGNAELRRSFGKDVLPFIGDTAVRLISEADLLRLLRNKGREQGRNRSAVVLYKDLLQLFRWAEKRQPWRGLLIDGNPAELIQPKQIVQANYDIGHERSRVLSLEEIAELQERFVSMQHAYAEAENRRSAPRPVIRETEIALWLTLSTTCRIGELLRAEWKDVDLSKGEWFVPQENTKTRSDWLVLLSPFARKQFEALREITGTSRWCFPAKSGDAHICEKTVSKQVGDRQAQFKSRQPLKNRRHDNTLVLAGGTKGEWTPHDLRRTGSTLMQSLKVAEHVRERCLNHSVGGKIGRIYGRYEYADEKREAWEKLGDLLGRTIVKTR